MNYVMVHYKGVTQGSDTLSTIWMKHKIKTLLQKLDWRQKKKERK